MKFKAVVSMERWSGHGEGGTLADVRIDVVPKLVLSNPYHSTEDDIERANEYAAEINRLFAKLGVLQ